MLPRVKILFLCTGNACRSQMAEGWTRALHGERIEAWSAGTAPHRVDPRAVRVMAEVGVDLAGHSAKHVDALAAIEPDWVVTVCDRAAESCPVLAGRLGRLHAGFDDPPRLAQGAASEEQALGHYRRVRDEIRAFVAGLPEALRAARRERSAP